MSDKAVEQIKTIDLSVLPEPFQLNASTIIVDLKLFIDATVRGYENTKSLFAKDVHFEHLKDFYKAVNDYKKNPNKYIVSNDKIPVKFEAEPEMAKDKPVEIKEKKKTVPKQPTPIKPTENNKHKGMSTLF